jgi:hypothetical protein
MENYYQLHRSTAINALLTKEKNPTQYTNLKLADLLESYYPEKARFYIVKEDNIELKGKNIIGNVMEF